MTVRNLDAMLNPRSVVLIGASSRPGSIGLTVARNLFQGGYGGRIDLVNLKAGSIEGRACVRSTRELPAVPELAIIATPPATIPALVREIGAGGTRAAVIISAGLDAVQKKAVLEAARPHCLRILGPNCLGLQITSLGINASFAHRAVAPGALALVSQSGAIMNGLIDWAANRNIGFSHVISLGDMVDVDFGDLLDYLAGSDAAYDAAFRRAGLLRVLDLDELFDAAEILARAPPGLWTKWPTSSAIPGQKRRARQRARSFRQSAASM